MNYEKILKDSSKNTMSEIIKDLIQEHQPKREKMLRLYRAYTAESVPIFYRRFDDPNKINNRLNNDYRKDIIDSIVGYLFGQPIAYQIDSDLYKEEDYERFLWEIARFKQRNNIEDLDAETGKMASICGYGARLCYIDRDGFERVMNVDPWEVIFVEDASIDEPQFAIRYYPMVMKEGKAETERFRAEVYDDKNITFYIQNNAGEYVLDPTVEKNPIPHMFKYVPLIKFLNNEEEKGDFEGVERLIDAYDRLLSDAQNEIEEFRQAYMVFTGDLEIKKETIQAARRSGAFQLPQGASLSFLTKSLNDTFLENHKKTLNENIYKFSQTVDMRDEKFSGAAQSGESRKWKLLPMENRAIIKERKFSKGIRQMFKVICSAWQVKGIGLNYLDIYWNFKRNIPVDIKYIADAVPNLKGIVSDETLLAQIPFVDDPQWEIEKLNQSAADYIPLGEAEEEAE